MAERMKADHNHPLFPEYERKFKSFDKDLDACFDDNDKIDGIAFKNWAKKIKALKEEYSFLFTIPSNNG